MPRGEISVKYHRENCIVGWIDFYWLVYARRQKTPSFLHLERWESHLFRSHREVKNSINVYPSLPHHYLYRVSCVLLSRDSGTLNNLYLPSRVESSSSVSYIHQSYCVERVETFESLLFVALIGEFGTMVE